MNKFLCITFVVLFSFCGASFAQGISDAEMKNFMALLYDRDKSPGASKPTESEMRTFSEAYYAVRKNADNSLDYVEKNPDDKNYDELLMDLAQAYNEIPDEDRVRLSRRIYDMVFDRFFDRKNPDNLLESCRRALSWGGLNPDAVSLVERVINESKDEYVIANATFILADGYLRRSMLKGVTQEDYESLRNTAKEYFNEVLEKYSPIDKWVIPFYRVVYANQNNGKEMPASKLGAEVPGILAKMDVVPVGSTALEINAKDLDGKEDALSKYKGKVVLIDFWATWCGPCVASLPKMVDFKESLSRSDFEIVSISVDGEVDTVVEFIENDQEMPWVNWHIGDQSPVAKEWGIDAFPTYILIDKEGVIRRKTHSFDDVLKLSIESLFE